MKLGIVVALVAAFGVGHVCLVEPEPVEACGMVFEKRDISALLVAQSAKSMKAGEYAAVVTRLEGFDAVGLLSGKGVSGTDARALRLVATAVVRSDGEAFPEQKEHFTHRQRLLWAVGMLESLEHDDDPRLRNARAEGLSRLYDRREDARRLLEDLAERDLITSPSAWAALAALRDQRGDELGRNDALARCALMSLRDEADCGPDAASLAGQPLAMRSSL